MKTFVLFFILAAIIACNNVNTNSEKSSTETEFDSYDTLMGHYDFDTIAQIENYHQSFNLPEIELDEEIVTDTVPEITQSNYLEGFGVASVIQTSDSIVVVKKASKISDPLDDFGNGTRKAPIKDPLDDFGSGDRVILKKENLIQHSDISKTIYELSAQLNSGDNADLTAIRRHIIWLFDEAGNGAPKKMEVWGFEVPLFQNITVPRGYLGARTCGNYAVLYGLVGKRDFSLRWLQAAQAHNSAAMNLFAQYPDYSINFAIKNYAARACTEMAIPYFGELSVVKDLLSNFSKSYRPAPSPPPEPDEKRPGGDRGGKN